MKIAAIVVLYEPDVKSLVSNLLSYVQEVDRLLLYQNSVVDLNAVENIEKLEPYASKIQYLGSGNNVGIAAALNEGVKWIQENGFTHFLTMDQDSSFPDKQLTRYKNLIENTVIKDAGIYGANPNNRGFLNFISHEVFLEVPDAITSGSIFPVDTFNRCGGFKDDLFIDAVDYEFCYRIKTLKGLKTIVFPAIILTHEVGYPTKIRFGFLTDNYSAFRTYYIVRNHIIIWRKYPDLFQPQYKKTLLKIHISYRLVKIIIGEEHKFSKIKSILLGIVHGLSKRNI